MKGAQRSKSKNKKGGKKVSIIEKWAEVFKQIGNADRFAIMTALHGSDHLYHVHLDENGQPVNRGCLSFSELLEITNIKPDTRLSYHLNCLIEASLIDKLAFKDSNGRVYPLYKKSKKWDEFANTVKIDEKIEAYLKERYPKDYLQ